MVKSKFSIVFLLFFFHLLTICNLNQLFITINLVYTVRQIIQLYFNIKNVKLWSIIDTLKCQAVVDY